MDNQKLLGLLADVVHLKEQARAVEALIDEKYSEILSELKESEAQKYSVEVQGEEVVARRRRNTRFKLLDAQRLVASITDPMEFSRALLENMSVTKKFVEALNPRFPVKEFFVEEAGNEFLEVQTKKALSEERILQERQIYVRELDTLRQKLERCTEDERVLLAPVFPREEAEVSDAD